MRHAHGWYGLRAFLATGLLAWSGLLWAAVPTVSLSVSPSSIVIGSSATLNWSSSGAASCAFSGALTGSVSVSGSTAVTPTATGSYTYTLTCKNASGSAKQSAVLKVTPPPLPTETVTFTPSTIVVGGSSTLSWSSANATSCSFSGSAYSGPVGLQSSPTKPVVVSPTAVGGYIETLTCTGPGGTTSSAGTLQVTLPPPPSITLAIQPVAINVGDTATLMWSSTNATSCAFSGAYTGSVALKSNPNKPLTVSPTTAGSYTYTLACTGTGGTSSKFVTLQVSPAVGPSVTLAVTPAFVPVGKSATLQWTSNNATSCYFSGAYTGSVGLQSNSSNPLVVTPAKAGVYNYVLTCAGLGGKTQDSVQLTSMDALSQKIYAAQQTAYNQSPSSSCGIISQNATGNADGFYWEIGDVGGPLNDSVTHMTAAGSVQPPSAVGQTWSRTTSMEIDSASKWMYAEFVAELKGQVTGSTASIPSRYVPFLNFTSGYDNMTDNCDQAGTVQDCLNNSNGGSPAVANGTQSTAHVGLFSYDSGHMQVLEAGADPNLAGFMKGGNNNVFDLAGEITAALQSKFVFVNLTYSSPLPAGGGVTTPSDYAQFLQGLLSTSNPLMMSYFLQPTASDPYAVCTNAYDPKCTDSFGNPLAVYAPVPSSVSWHYGLGHWIEDDPETGDGAYSSPGKSGFYPWIDSSKTYYGMVARYDTNNTGNALTAPFYQSAVCGAAIRKAFTTGVAQP